MSRYGGDDKVLTGEPGSDGRPPEITLDEDYDE